MRFTFTAVVCICLSVLSVTGCTGNGENRRTTELMSTVADSTLSVPVQPVELDSFGFPYDSSTVEDHRVVPNESLYLILDKLNFTPQQIYSVINRAEDVFDVFSFKPGQSYRTYASSDSAGSISRLVWQPGAVDYVVFEWQDSLNIYRESKDIVTREETAAAEITTSLYEAIEEVGTSPMLAYRLSEIFAWQLDFFNLRRGDSFKVVYEELYVDGRYYDLGEILAVHFTHRGETYTAYRYEDGEVSGYFNERGESLQKALLKTPFLYNQRISSGFSNNRFHPVLKQNMPHHGVDYAAPHGTPVLSVGDGTVTEARYRGANGNIVKIRHNNTYETAYLHLQGFGPGIRSGAEVEQGQVIGYVGSTGRVTGTHLDYRIYRNGSPVNPLTLDLPASRSIPEESMSGFISRSEYYRGHIDYIPDHHMISAR